MQIILDGREKSIRHSSSIAELLKKLEVRREEVVVKLNGKLAPETAQISSKDKVEIIRVIFGG